MDNPFLNINISPYKNSLDHLTDISKLFRFAVCSLAEDSFQVEFSSAVKFILEREKITSSHLSFLIIKERFQLSDFECFCIKFAIASSADEFIGDVLLRHSKNRLPSLGLAVSLYTLCYDLYEDNFLCLEYGKPLYFLLHFDENIFMSKHFYLKNEVFTFLSGGVINTSNDYALEKIPLNYADIYSPCAAKIISAIKETKSPQVIAVLGEKGSGKHTLTAKCCEKLGFCALSVVTPTDDSLFEDFARKISCICILNNCIPIFNSLPEKLLKFFTNKIKIIFLCADKKVNLIKVAKYRSVFPVILPELSRNEKISLWKNQLNDKKNFPFEYFADTYRLSPAKIAAVCSFSSSSSNDFAKDIICQRISLLNAGNEFSKIITSNIHLQDLVVNKKTEKLLNEIKIILKHKTELFSNYGFNKIFPYGRGLGALFFGPPGTGKTMAASALGNELGLDIMSADLSGIVDKYIGETEKRLSEIFNTAKENNCILFFDEADSLFAKRTEADSSNDRYANTQTAHLLQKMEEYEGFVVLATNLAGNIDEAFRRRIAFIVEFTKPSSTERKLLWRKFIPENMPKEDIDIDFLSLHFDLSPACLKWAAFSASANALAESKKLSLSHILSALKYEYQKSGADFPKITYDNIKL